MGGFKHGHRNSDTRTPTYNSWRAMRARCTNTKYKSYHRYGGRGIKVSTRWEKFDNFLADMGERPEGMTLDRINVDGDYCTENCRWADLETQTKNKGTRNG